MKLLKFIKDSIERHQMQRYYNQLSNSIDAEDQQKLQLDILFGNINGIELY